MMYFNIVPPLLWCWLYKRFQFFCLFFFVNLLHLLMTLLGSEIPDDRNLLNENLWSPDRPKFQGVAHKGKCWIRNALH